MLQLWIVVASLLVFPVFGEVEVLDLNREAAFLFAGDPVLLVCKEKKADIESRNEQFLLQLEAELRSSSTKIRVAKVSCGSKFALPRSGELTTLQKKARLKREGLNMPVLVWAANGQVLKQVPAKSFTSPLSGGDKSSGQAQLDAKRLARSLSKSAKAKIYSLATNSQFSSECLGLEHQICVVILKQGGKEKLSSKKVSRIVDSTSDLRFARFFVLDTKRFKLVFDPKFPRRDSLEQDESVIVFRRKEFAFLGPSFFDQENVDLDSSHKVAETDKFDSGIALSLGMEAIAKSKTAKERMAAFRKAAIQSANAAKFDPEARKKSLAFLFHSESSTEGFILDWEAARPLLMMHAVFNRERPSKQKLKELQKESILRRRNSGPSKSKPSVGSFVAIHEKSVLAEKSKIRDMFELMLDSPEKQWFVPAREKPKLSKVSIKTSASGTKEPQTSTRKVSAKSSSSIERERQRRKEMDEEALLSGAFAMPSDSEIFDDFEADDTNEDDDNDDVDDDVFLDEEEEEENPESEEEIELCND